MGKRTSEFINASRGNDLYVFGPFRLDAAERLLSREGEPVPLAGKTFDLLLMLVGSAGHLKSREDLIQALWPKTIVVENSLSWYVSALRKALGDEGKIPRYIKTVRGQGYRFIAPVTRETVEPPPASRRRRILSGGALLAAIVILAGLFIGWRRFEHKPAGRTASPAPTRSIAVLPFENLSGNPANAYFAAGIQDTILTKLSGIADLRVTSRTSTEQYPSHPGNLPRVARELGVATVLEGSVQKAGNRVLINVQLITAASDNHIWAQSYTRTLDNVFAVESDVAEQVASALKAKLLPAERARVAKSPTRDPKAYDLFLQANYLARQITGTYNASDPVAVTNKAISLYRKAIVRDPRFALAYARLSYLESRVYWRTIDHSSRRIAAAIADARKALELAPDLGEAHLAAGYAAYYGKRDYASALKQFKLAAQSMPNNAEVLNAISLIRLRQGFWRQALTNQRKAVKLDPRNPHLPFDIGTTLALARHYPQAIKQLNRALAIEPYNFLALTYKVWTQLLAGETKQATQTIADIPPISGPFGQMASVHFQAAWLARRPRAALAALDKAPAWIQAPDFVGQVPVTLLRARALALAGEQGRARSEYEQARKLLRSMVLTQPDNPDFLSALGLVEAGLGDKKQAILDGRRAADLVPISRDAIAGTLYVITLAKIYARSDEAASAIKLLGKLLAIPAGLTVSVPLLKMDPVWDPIRHNPAFQALLKQYGQSTPAAAAPLSRFTPIPMNRDKTPSHIIRHAGSHRAIGIVEVIRLGGTQLRKSERFLSYP